MLLYDHITMGTSRTCIILVTIQLISMITAQEVAKRVPQGFMGMRGKKLDAESAEQLFKRKPQFFVGVKGKKSNYDSLENDMMDKRVPMGFVGMRGKKETYEPNWYFPGSDDYVPKRDGSLIGEIDYSSNNGLKKLDDEEFPILNEFLTEYLNKFEGPADMPDESLDPNANTDSERISNEVDKRAANFHQFYGVRGKKSIQNKRPYDLTFRGKFIGVRGKKDLKNSGPQEVRFLLGPNGPWPKRRAQMGFFGMRGKKWTYESNSEMETPN